MFNLIFLLLQAIIFITGLVASIEFSISLYYLYLQFLLLHLPELNLFFTRPNHRNHDILDSRVLFSLVTSTRLIRLFLSRHVCISVFWIFGPLKIHPISVLYSYCLVSILHMRPYIHTRTSFSKFSIFVSSHLVVDHVLQQYILLGIRRK